MVVVAHVHRLRGDDDDDDDENDEDDM